jgi:signal recognition particle GTPase
MMDEIARVHKAIQPQKLFVVDAMTGQDKYCKIV